MYFCCTLLCVHSSFGVDHTHLLFLQSSWWGREVALPGLSSWCLVMVVWLFLAVPWICMQFVIVVFSDHTCTHIPFLISLIHIVVKTDK